jgi:hypothetical protein
VLYESGNLDGFVTDRAAKRSISGATGGGARQLRRGRERGNGRDGVDVVDIDIYTSHNIFPTFREYHVG